MEVAVSVSGLPVRSLTKVKERPGMMDVHEGRCVLNSLYRMDYRRDYRKINY